MLYRFYLFSMMFASVMGILYMIYINSFMFVFFPIAILIGGLYYFFKDYDDNRYEVRNYYTSRGNKYYNRNLYSLENDNPSNATNTTYDYNPKHKTYTSYLQETDSNIYDDIIKSKKVSNKIKVVEYEGN